MNLRALLGRFGGAAAPPAPAPRDEPAPALVQNLVALVDELERTTWTAEQRVAVDHVVASVAEVLQRADVEIIDAPEPYDRRRHAVPGAVPAGARVAGVLSPGFVLDQRVLRRATVRLEDRP